MHFKVGYKRHSTYLQIFPLFKCWFTPQFTQSKADLTVELLTCIYKMLKSFKITSQTDW